MGDEASTEAILSDAYGILDTAAACARFKNRKAPQRFQRACCASLCNLVANRVRLFTLSLILPLTKVFYATTSWSYGVNMTLIGNGVFVSMDIPDVFLAVSRLVLDGCVPFYTKRYSLSSPNYAIILIWSEPKSFLLWPFLASGRESSIPFLIFPSC